MGSVGRTGTGRTAAQIAQEARRAERTPAGNRRRTTGTRRGNR